MPLQVLNRFDELDTRWTTVGFEESFDIADIANVAIIT